MVLKKLAFILALVAPFAANAAGCGEYAVGRSPETGDFIVGAFPFQQVNEQGFWEFCSQPPACPPTRNILWGKPGKSMCAPRATFKPVGNVGQVTTVLEKDWRGSQTWVCTSQGWRKESERCSQ